MKVRRSAVAARAGAKPLLGGVLVGVTLLSSALCVAAFFRFGAGTGMRLLLAETLLLFLILWVLSRRVG
jgi:hypothetical protein